MFYHWNQGHIMCVKCYCGHRICVKYYCEHRICVKDYCGHRMCVKDYYGHRTCVKDNYGHIMCVNKPLYSRICWTHIGPTECSMLDWTYRVKHVFNDTPCICMFLEMRETFVN